MSGAASGSPLFSLCLSGLDQHPPSHHLPVPDVPGLRPVTRLGVLFPGWEREQVPKQIGGRSVFPLGCQMTAFGQRINGLFATSPDIQHAVVPGRIRRLIGFARKHRGFGASVDLGNIVSPELDPGIQLVGATGLLSGLDLGGRLGNLVYVPDRFHIRFSRDSKCR